MCSVFGVGTVAFFPVSWLSMIAATEGVRIALTVGWLVYFRICAKALEVAVAI